MSQELRWSFLTCFHDNDNDNMTLLPDTLFVSAVDLALRDLLASAGWNNSIIREALQTLKEGLVPSSSTLADWTVEDGLTFYKGRCYVPDNMEVRRQAVLHTHPQALLGTKLTELSELGTERYRSVFPS